jgi:hypothetical protein
MTPLLGEGNRNPDGRRGSFQASITDRHLTPGVGGIAHARTDLSFDDLELRASCASGIGSKDPPARNVATRRAV